MGIEHTALAPTGPAVTEKLLQPSRESVGVQHALPRLGSEHVAQISAHILYVVSVEKYAEYVAVTITA